MRIVGIIAEYNPFHLGHLHHLEQTKKITGADYLVAVISGNFVQRGGPAIFDKWQRAAMAVSSGVDLVLELPTYYATSSAENFANGAIKLLTDLGVDSVCAGAETADIELLDKLANEMLSSDYQRRLKLEIKKGLAYHLAVAKVLSLEHNFSFSANNILALEYLKAIKKQKSHLKLELIERQGSAYQSVTIDSEFASATAIRRQLLKKTVNWQLLKQHLPDKVYQQVFSANYYTSLEDFKYIFNAQVIAVGADGLAEIRGVGEGLENRIMANLSNVLSLEDLVEMVSSKRYPQTRIRRIITNLLLNIKKEQPITLEQLDYARILAYYQPSRELLKYLKQNTSLFMITNLARDLKKYRRKNSLLELDIKATGVYATVNRSVELRADYLRHPIRQINR